MENKKYKNLEDLLPEGEHMLKVYPQEIWSDQTKSYTKNTLKSGTSKTGFTWYMFKTKVGEEYVSLFANDKNKADFERGYIKANIVPKKDKTSGKEVYTMGDDGNMHKELRVFFNPASDVEIQLAMQQYRDGKNNAPVKQEPEENDINVEEIPW